MVDARPKTPEAARANGIYCREAGKDISYNPYRNTPNDDAHLYEAWLKGWHDGEKHRSHASGY